MSHDLNESYEEDFDIVSDFGSQPLLIARITPVWMVIKAFIYLFTYWIILKSE